MMNKSGLIDKFSTMSAIKLNNGEQDIHSVLGEQCSKREVIVGGSEGTNAAHTLGTFHLILAPSELPQTLHKYQHFRTI